MKESAPEHGPCSTNVEGKLARPAMVPVGPLKAVGRAFSCNKKQFKKHEFGKLWTVTDRVEPALHNKGGTAEGPWSLRALRKPGAYC